MSCPFKVGDHVHELRSKGWFGFGIQYPSDDQLEWELDTAKPDATVTAVMDDGFTFEYDHPIPFGRAAWGQMQTGGTVYPQGYLYWRKVS